MHMGNMIDISNQHISRNNLASGIFFYTFFINFFSIAFLVLEKIEIIFVNE